MQSYFNITVDTLAKAITEIRDYMYKVENDILDPEKIVGGADTVEAVDAILARHGLRPSERDDDRIGGILVFSPINECVHQDREDGCCHHPASLTGECHNFACPLLRTK